MYYVLIKLYSEELDDSIQIFKMVTHVDKACEIIAEKIAECNSDKNIYGYEIEDSTVYEAKLVNGVYEYGEEIYCY